MTYAEDLDEKLIDCRISSANLKCSLKFISTANHISCYQTGAISFIFYWKYGLSEMIVGVLTTCHTQYIWDRSICVFLFNRTTLQVFVTYLIGALLLFYWIKKYIYSYLKCIVYDKLLKPRQSFRISLYLFRPPSYSKLVDPTLLQVLWQPWVPPCSLLNNHAMASYILPVKSVMCVSRRHHFTCWRIALTLASLQGW